MMIKYCEYCQIEVDEVEVDHKNCHKKCGEDVIEIADTNFAAWGETGYAEEHEYMIGLIDQDEEEQKKNR